MRYQTFAIPTQETTSTHTKIDGTVSFIENSTVNPETGVYLYIAEHTASASQPIDWYIAGVEIPFKTWTPSTPNLPKIIWTNDPNCLIGSTTVFALSSIQQAALCELMSSENKNDDDWIKLIIQN